MPIQAVPLIRWAGSKRQYVSTLLKFMRRNPPRYIEPFCGSAAVFFTLAPTTAILADVNAALIDFYATLKLSPNDVYDTLVEIPRDRDTYYRARDEFNAIPEPIKRAALFYYLNKNCFNGLYRTSLDGNFNVPFSPKRTGVYPDRGAFLAAASRLRVAVTLCADFESVIKLNCQEGDLVYLDPPYSGADRYPFREYFPNCFSIKDVPRLADTLHHIDVTGAKFVLTYSAALPIEPIPYRWRKFTFRTRRNIAGKSQDRGYVDDVVLTNVR